jgi:hypothetical protein
MAKKEGYSIPWVDVILAENMRDAAQFVRELP